MNKLLLLNMTASLHTTLQRVKKETYTFNQTYSAVLIRCLKYSTGALTKSDFKPNL